MSHLNQLRETANNLVKEGKGILAADESNPTCTKRFEAIGIESNFQTRNEYRDILLTSLNIEEYISGVILFEETLKQTTTCNEKIAFPDLLTSKGILPGIKVDKGAKILEGSTKEKITEGLDGLDKRLEEYYSLGARFAKWRAVITIGENIPTNACLNANAHALARYAAKCQQVGIVPIVEPEVLMDGHHTIERCNEITNQILKCVFEQLSLQNVYLEGIILKPNMVIAGTDCTEQANIEKVADMTYECLRNNVPESVPGIAFLSGGQSGSTATSHLYRMNKKYISDMPWRLTFSYGRALQQDALNSWAGKKENRTIAQEKFIYQAKNNSLATLGKSI